MPRDERIFLSTSNPLELFSYTNNNTITKISILGNQYNHIKQVYSREYKGYTVEHDVQFTYCGIRLHNSYVSLSTIFAVLKVYEKQRYSRGTKKIIVQIPSHNTDERYVFSRLVRSTQGHDVMECGISYSEHGQICMASQTMHIGYVYSFQNALLKAMNWIAPMQGIESILSMGN